MVCHERSQRLPYPEVFHRVDPHRPTVARRRGELNGIFATGSVLKDVRIWRHRCGRPRRRPQKFTRPRPLTAKAGNRVPRRRRERFHLTRRAITKSDAFPSTAKLYRASRR
jgi:hypothetical protein